MEEESVWCVWGGGGKGGGQDYLPMPEKKQS